MVFIVGVFFCPGFAEFFLSTERSFFEDLQEPCIPGRIFGDIQGMVYMPKHRKDIK